MPFYPTLDAPETTRLFTDTFAGYNHNLKIGDGEFYDTKNLTSDYYPVMSQRAKRGVGDAIANPLGLSARTNLAYIDGSAVYFGEYEVTGITVDPETLPKQMVSMGAYLCIFPDAKYFNTENITDCGSMGALFESGTLSSESKVSYTPCNITGSAYTVTNITSTMPESPANGDYWIDTTEETHVLKQYSEATAQWVQVLTVYTKITRTGIGTNFNVGDGVTISGCSVSGETDSITSQIAALNTNTIIYALDANYIVVVGMLDQAVEQSSDEVVVERKVPTMDYVTESNNRLWGCFYGLNDDDKALNEIYACKLGDFKNWNCFAGISTDSYAVSVGSDGVFTGAVTHLGYPLFFKENCIHKIYGNYPANYQIETKICRGVQDGSFRSLQVVNETLLYKSTVDVCAYDGSLPASVSSALGNEKYSDAVAGAVGSKYFISMQDGASTWHMFVLDTSKGIWMREDNTHALFFARNGEELFYVDSSKYLMAVNGTGTAEGDVSWEAVTGIVGYDYPDKKYLSRFNLRMNLPIGSSLEMFFMYDSSGVWERVARVDGRGLGTSTLPIKPRRCDHVRVKLTGTGEIKLYSIARILEVGSDV